MNRQNPRESGGFHIGLTWRDNLNLAVETMFLRGWILSQHPSVFLFPFTIKHLKENSLSSVFLFSHHHSVFTVLQSGCSSHFFKEMLFTFTGNSLIPNLEAFGSVLLHLVFPIMSGTIVLLFSLNLLKALVIMIMPDFLLCISDRFVFSFSAHLPFLP